MCDSEGTCEETQQTATLQNSDTRFFAIKSQHGKSKVRYRHNLDDVGRSHLQDIREDRH
jgi:hypothetical protein